jgi:hypothetical protein
MAHMMVVSEEEFLILIFGADYERYCQQVPRYLRFYGKKVIINFQNILNIEGTTEVIRVIILGRLK